MNSSGQLGGGPLGPEQAAVEALVFIQHAFGGEAFAGAVVGAFAVDFHGAVGRRNLRSLSDERGEGLVELRARVPRYQKDMLHYFAQRHGTTVDEACTSCHAEKRGPFVFEHVNGVAGDCMSCHENHGSSNNKRLKRATVKNLCLECHSTLSTKTLGSQPPSFHNVSLPRYQNCTTCHVAVHGSYLSPLLLK